MLAGALMLAFIGFVGWVAFSVGHYLGSEETGDAYERGKVDERRRITKLMAELRAHEPGDWV